MNQSAKNKKTIIITAIICALVTAFSFFFNLSNYLEEYNSCIAAYEGHEHSDSCFKKNLTCTSKSYWHSHKSSCYTTKINCSYSYYDDAESYASTCADFDFTPTLIVFAVSAVLLLLVGIGFKHIVEFIKSLFYKLDNSFDEKNDKWIHIFKIWIKLIFILEIIAGIVWAVIDPIEYIFWGRWFGFIVRGAIAVAIAVVVAFFNKTINMLILQYLNNINDTRKGIDILVQKANTEAPAEEKAEETEASDEPAENEPEDEIAESQDETEESENEDAEE